MRTAEHRTGKAQSGKDVDRAIVPLRRGKQRTGQRHEQNAQGIIAQRVDAERRIHRQR